MHAYTSLCLATGIRTEEARELRWDHVDFGDPTARPPVPASVAVWRSVRADGETKTEKSRRTLGLPQMAVDALRIHRERQEKEQRAAGVGWSEHGLVFAARTGGALDAANVRREFKAACRAAKIGEGWTPRELRPVLTTGAEAMDRLFRPQQPVRHSGARARTATCWQHQVA
jgi:integrase